MEKPNKFDVIVVGGGPAGILAADRAGLRGMKVLLLEKMKRLGNKLRITGKGRCNLTNATTIAEFMLHFGKNGHFLKPAFYHFFVNDLRKLLTQNGIRTIVERGNRIFPECESAPAVTEALIRQLIRSRAQIRTGTAVTALNTKDGSIIGVTTNQSEHLSAKRVILCTGGGSYPRTGSTGDGYTLSQAVGHTIVPIRPALVPLDTAGNTARRLQNLPLKNVTAALRINGKKQAEAFGEMLFTPFGLSGPIILTLSRQVVDALNQKLPVIIAIDLKPALDHRKLDARLLRDIDKYAKKDFKSLLKSLLPLQLIPVCLDQTGIPGDKPAGNITANERKQLRLWLKNFLFEISGYRPLEEALITAGGVNLREVNPQTMESRIVRGLYFAGEVLDIDADTGGYNLQAAFSTGSLAGSSAADNSKF